MGLRPPPRRAAARSSPAESGGTDCEETDIKQEDDPFQDEEDEPFLVSFACCVFFYRQKRISPLQETFGHVAYLFISLLR